MGSYTIYVVREAMHPTEQEVELMDELGLSDYDEFLERVESQRSTFGGAW